MSFGFEPVIFDPGERDGAEHGVSTFLPAASLLLKPLGGATSRTARRPWTESLSISTDMSVFDTCRTFNISSLVFIHLYWVFIPYARMHCT
jgi:hypothetical protein